MEVVLKRSLLGKCGVLNSSFGTDVDRVLDICSVVVAVLVRWLEKSGGGICSSLPVVTLGNTAVILFMWPTVQATPDEECRVIGDHLD